MLIATKKIQAVNNDERINEIRSEVSQHNDAIPYMLLPVRMETKFRTVQLTAGYSVQQVEKIIEALGEIHLIVIEVLEKANAIKLRTIITRIGDVTVAVKDVYELQVKEKGWIKQVWNALKIDLNLIPATGRVSFRTESTSVKRAIKELDTALDGIGTLRDRSDALSTWMDKLALEVSAYQLLGGPKGNIPFINVKNKKDLYQYIDRRFATLFDFFGNSKSDLSAVKYIEQNQLSTIALHATSLRRASATIPATLASIHDDSNWQKFVETTVNSNIKQLGAALDIFENETISFLKTLPPPPKLGSGELIFHGVLTLVKLKKFNTSKKTGFEEQKRFRKYLQPRIDLLQKALSDGVEESKPGHIDTIQKMYGTLGESLKTTSQRITKFQPTNKSQTFGNELAKSFVTNKLNPIVEALKGQSVTGVFPGRVIVPKLPQTEYQLCIRIYPDDIMVITHDPALTEEEVIAGKQFWKTWWIASRDTDLEKAAWQVLVSACGTRRASWLVRSLKPALSEQANKDAYDERPSEKIIDILTLIQSNIDLLKALPLVSAFNLLKSIETTNVLKSVVKNIKKGISLIETIGSEQEFLVSKLISLNVQASSQYNLLIEKSLTLTNAETAQCSLSLTELESVIALAAEFNVLNAALPKVDGSVFATGIADPFVYPAVTIKPKDLNMQPYCGALPDRFVAITMNNGVYQHVKVGNTVTQNLPVGIDPTSTNSTHFTPDADGNLIIADNLKWMFEYDKAVEEGMGITLKLTKKQYDEGFDKILVLGTKNTNASAGQALTEQLFTNLIYSEDGLDFLKVGTPTNNTEYRKSGYQIGADTDERYRIEVEESILSAESDGAKLAKALGVNPGVVGYTNYSNNREITNALNMNRALFNGTVGHYMEEMFDTIFTYDNIRRTESLFVDNILGRGYLPSLRAGMQPYGILPTTAFSWLEMDTKLQPLSWSEMGRTALPFTGLSQRIQSRFDYRLLTLLRVLYAEYAKLENQYVINYANLDNGSDVSDRFTEMLCLHPVSMNYFFRQSINIARGPNTEPDKDGANYSAVDEFGPTRLFDRFKNLMFDGINYPSMDFADETGAPDPVRSKQKDRVYSRIQEQFVTSRNFGNRALDVTSPISGTIVTEDPEFNEAIKDTVPVGNNTINYIEWLLNQTTDQLLGGNAWEDPARLPDKSLLFMLLRQSLLQAYQEAALEIMQKEKFFSEEQRKNLGGRYNYHFRSPDPATKQLRNVYVTKWHMLFKHFETLPLILRNNDIINNAFYQYINGDRKSMARYLDQVRGAASVYNLFAATHKVHFEKLRSVREAIASLAHLPGAELEILLGEHIDVSTHRLDSWMLSLVNRRLSLQRAAKPAGLFLGAYCYQENLRRDTNRTEYQKDIRQDFKVANTENVYHDADNQGFIHAPSIGHAITAAIMRSAYMGNISGEDEKNRLSVNLSSSRVRMAMKLIEGLNNNQSVNALLGFQFEKALHERFR
ncbi:MAG: hypothetical protein ABW174_12660, partial [Flavitalea sp.]